MIGTFNEGRLSSGYVCIKNDNEYGYDVFAVEEGRINFKENEPLDLIKSSVSKWHSVKEFLKHRAQMR